ncbi:MAG TPA: M1 family metallopeptidase [Candidatus Tetragenococcus pullicola]|nr:M1 family metallopeptidase [Candidatus Tetragenococcus pullicola]
MAEEARFYTQFQPNHYEVYLDINRETKIISGKTTISGNATNNAPLIHQKYLEVSEVLADGKNVAFTTDEKQEAIQIELAHPGEINLTITYTAPLTDSMMGIYPSYYTINGEKKQLIGTQFETTSARQAFPCVDEPEAKATFDLAIKFDEQAGETIIANMPEIKVENGVHYFDTTVKMSTYLLAFGFGEMQSKTTTTKSGVKIGVFGTKAHQLKEFDFALDIAKRSIEFYEDFYQTPYPLPHSWQLGLPDFSAGAMENWGLVTYREAYLLLDPDNTSFQMKQVVATVIAHELAHQWFGDLVTMKWWDDLWLNESFANMMEYVAIDAIEPDFHIWELFQTSEVTAALQRDATDGVQSVHVQVESPAEIDSIFDSAIVYAKGARMLVMVRALIGDDALREGLKNYFVSHQYKNATGADLWTALGETSGLDLKAIMDTWLEQPGYPVVTAKVIDGNLVLNQQQFFTGEGKEVGRNWQIPLNSNYEAVPQLMTETSLNLGDYESLRQANKRPFRLNVGNSSHFIVNYDAALLADILAHVDKLDAISQLQLLQDLRLLAEGGKVSYSEIVPLLPKFAKSKSSVVNDALYRVVNNLKKFVTPDTNEEKNLKAFVNQLSHQQVERLGWQPVKGESVDDQLTRPFVLSAALYGENDQAKETAHDLFQENKEQLTSLPADIRAYILINEVKNYGSQELFDRLLNDYRQTTDGGYKYDIVPALTSSLDEELLKQIISKFKDPDTIKPQDLRSWYYQTLANKTGEQLAWDWIRSEWQWLEDTVGGDMSFTSFITVTTNVFNTAKRFTEFKEFFEPKKEVNGLTREIIMDTNVIKNRVALVEKEKEAVNKAVETVLK